MRHAQLGVVVAGSPVGDLGFMRDFAVERIEAVRQTVQRLRDLHGYLSAQDAFLLLRFGLEPPAFLAQGCAGKHPVHAR